MVESQSQKQVGRAMNALQDYLISRLLVPKIYLDVLWNGAPVSVLAIDRAGVGDVHAVWIIYLSPGLDTSLASMALNARLPGTIEEMKLLPAMEEAKSRPTHFRYVAIVSDNPSVHRFELSDEVIQKSLADDGVGRVGILHVDLSGLDTSVRLVLKPERFRSSKEVIEMADKYVAEHTPNWEIRE